ncbi:hypothetical protein ScPMuIL_007200 [Solemya velum]
MAEEGITYGRAGNQLPLVRQGKPHPFLGKFTNEPGEGWLPSDDLTVTPNCFYYSERKMTYKKARNDCLKRGGLVVSIDSEAKNTMILAHFNRSSSWLGLTPDPETNTLSWYNCLFDQSIYTNWLPGEPNKQNGKQSCTQMRKRTGGWNDVPCEKKLRYTCERGTDWTNNEFIAVLSWWDDTGDMTFAIDAALDQNISCTYPNQISYTYPNQISYPYPNQISYTYPNQISYTYPNQISYTYPNQISYTYPNQISYT